MKIYKFGGTSVGSAERIKAVSALVNDGDKKIVVLSAMSGTTNSLVEIIEYYYKKNSDAATEAIAELENKYTKVVKELFKNDSYISKANCFLKERFAFLKHFSCSNFSISDEKAILAQGEIISTNLFQLYNEENKIDSVLLNALEFVKVDSDGEPLLNEISVLSKKVLEKYPKTKLFVTQGFICTNPEGQIDNLKRGGSDYSASLIGAGIDAEEVQIWTDIDGVHNNDPRYVEGTYPIAKLSFDEAAELAYFGAKILHPASILPAKHKNIPVVLKNTMEPSAAGTYISNENVGEGIKAIAAKDNITAIKIKSGRMLLAYGFMRRIFEIFEKHKTSIDMIATSEVAVSLTIDNDSKLDAILNELREIGSVTVDKNQTIVCVVGNMISEAKGFAAQILNSISDVSVRMISYGGSRHNISIVIDTENKIKALKLLNDNLFTKKN
jgi:aspartate kinase